MRTLKFIFLIGILGISMTSFSPRDESSIKLISPLGFKIANSQMELLDILNEKSPTEIISLKSIRFIENENFNAAEVVVNLIDGKIQVYIIGKGKILSDTNTYSFGKTIVYSCDGCSDCRVSGTLEEGVLTVTCTQTCCTLHSSEQPISI